MRMGLQRNSWEVLDTERVGFEPTEGCPSNDFESFAFDHSATSPTQALPTHIRLTVNAALAFVSLWRHCNSAQSSSAPPPKPFSTSCATETGVRSDCRSLSDGSGGEASRYTQTRSTVAIKQPLLRAQLQLGRLIRKG